MRFDTFHESGLLAPPEREDGLADLFLCVTHGVRYRPGEACHLCEFDARRADSAMGAFRPFTGQSRQDAPSREELVEIQATERESGRRLIGSCSMTLAFTVVAVAGWVVWHWGR